MKIELIKSLIGEFELCSRKIDGLEFWMARDIQRLLGYEDWRNFLQVVDKSKIACENGKQQVKDHFVGVNKMIRNLLRDRGRTYAFDTRCHSDRSKNFDNKFLSQT